MTSTASNRQTLGTRGSKRAPTTTATTTAAALKTNPTANMKIFNENLVPGVKPSQAAVAKPKRAALGEITNKIVADDAKSKLTKRKDVKTDTSNASMITVNTQLPAAAPTRRVPIQPLQKAAPAAKPLAKEPLPIPNPVPIESVVDDEDIDEDAEDDIEVFEEIPSQSIEPMDIEDHLQSFRDIAQPTARNQIMNEIWDSEEEEVDPQEEVEDIDQYDTEDPQFCTEYVHHIFKYCREKEVKDRINANYMEKQVDITDKHRMILIDWLAEVAVKFKLLTETMFLSINIIDRFLQYKAVARQKLQLVGVTAMLIASKYEEIYTPEVNDFVWISAKAYTREEMLKMERLILLTLDFNLNIPTPLHFLRRFSKAARSDSKVHTLSKYLTELSLLDYKMLNYLPSVIAAAAVYISRSMLASEIAGPTWNATLEYYTHYKVEDIMPCVLDLNGILLKQSSAANKYKATFKKYENPKLLAVAEIPPVHI